VAERIPRQNSLGHLPDRFSVLPASTVSVSPVIVADAHLAPFLTGIQEAFTVTVTSS